MAEMRRRYDPEFRAGAVRIVQETGKSAAEVARELGINGTTPATWVSRERAARGRPQPVGWTNPMPRSWRGCGGRTPSCGWSVMSWGVAWSCG